MRKTLLVALAGFLAAGCIPTVLQAQVANGFDLTDSLVPEEEIMGGGPPRDGIPALVDPARDSAEKADRWLRGEDRVLGIEINDVAVAYPISILTWHEIVNDIVGGRPVAVTFCPLCGTGVVFEAGLIGERMVFGVSGLLYKSDVLMYDRATDSLFSQLLMQGITGPLRGTRLEAVPAAVTTWKAWKGRHPNTWVLSRALPFGRDYGTDPYGQYHKSGSTMFPVRGVDRSHRPKEWAYLILSAGKKFLVAESVLKGFEKDGIHRFRFSDGEIVLVFDPENRELLVRGGPAGEEVVIPGYWFALSAFHPDARRIDESDLESAPSLPPSPAR